MFLVVLLRHYNHLRLSNQKYLNILIFQNNLRYQSILILLLNHYNHYNLILQLIRSIQKFPVVLEVHYIQMHQNNQMQKMHLLNHYNHLFQLFQNNH